MITLDNWKVKLETQDNKDSDNDRNPSPYSQLGIPHNYDNKMMFIDNFNCCSREVYYAMRFCSDLNEHLYPHSKVEDTYVHLPLIGHNETTNEGMMLTNTALLEALGLLEKEPNGKRYNLHPNALKHLVFVYGDALSVTLHSTLYDKILHGITRLVNKEYCKMLLSAPKHLYIQKGQFHQQIHLLGTIHSIFMEDSCRHYRSGLRSNKLLVI